MNRIRTLGILAGVLLITAAALLARVSTRADEATRPAAPAQIPDDLGKILYEHYCRDCHGDTGRGDGRNAFMLQPQPPDFKSSTLARDGAAALTRFITNGSGDSGRSPLCPPWGRTIPPEYIPDLAHYVTSLASAP